MGSTELAEALDPEDLRDLTSTYHAVCDTAIRHHDGHIAQYLGDGVLVYFGYPNAHEDDARRAVRAALEILAGLEERAGRLHSQHGFALDARMGIHTGPVVVGEIGSGERREQLALGKTPNLAARIQNIAGKNEVAVSDDTYRIVRGFFDFSPLGAHRIKGLSEVVTVHRVLRESGAESRLDVERRTGLAPLSGRNAELTRLLERWSTLSTRGGHAVLLEGEAGIGKSRIVDSLREHARLQSATILECFCTPYAQNAPLFPIVGLIGRVLGFTRETADEDKRTALDQRLELRGILTEETSALMSSLLSLPPPASDPLVNYSAQKRRERTLETLLTWLLAVAQDGPTLLAIEDLHWIDPTTLQFMGSVVESLSSVPLMVILTFRPDFRAPWHANGRVSSIVLSRLSPLETSSLAVHVAHGKPLPPAVLAQIVQRTEGIPLFVEEVTKAVLELGVLEELEDRFELAGPMPPDLIPSTVQDSLNARLDRLGPAKAVAQLASTIGREFTYALLSTVNEGSDTELRQHLHQLLEAGLVYRSENSPEEAYLFKHALVRDAAYMSLLRKSRRALHQRIAESLIGSFPETAKHNPDLVAEHFSAAGNADQAVTFWLQAGQMAVARAANHEAITHLNRGLELVPQLHEAVQAERELELLITLIPALIAAEGWVSAQLQPVYRRAAELVEVLKETPHRFTLLAGVMGYHFVAGRITQSLELAKQILELAGKIGDPLFLTMGRQDCSAAYCYHGDFRLAVEHAEAGLAMLDLERERLIGRTLGLSSCVGLLAYANVALWMLSFTERSKHAAERCLALARQIGHPPSIGFALTAATASSYLQRDVKATLSFAEEALRVAREERLGFWEPMITVFRGWGLSEMGEHAEGSGVIRDAIERYHKAGNRVEQVWFHVILAETQWKAGQWSEAFETLAIGRRLAQENGEGLFEPELYRLEGEFLLAQAMGTHGPSEPRSQDSMSRLARAETRIGESIALARSQEAKMLELRSLVSLCRVRRESGEALSARSALASVYDTFTDGFQTFDLREARAMLEAINT